MVITQFFFISSLNITKSEEAKKSKKGKQAKKEKLISNITFYSKILRIEPFIRKFEKKIWQNNLPNQDQSSGQMDRWVQKYMIFETK